jgi:hypothetical protein
MLLLRNRRFYKFINGNFVIFSWGCSIRKGFKSVNGSVNEIPNVRLVVASYYNIQHELERYLNDKINVLYLGNV